MTTMAVELVLVLIAISALAGRSDAQDHHNAANQRPQAQQFFPRGPGQYEPGRVLTVPENQNLIITDEEPHPTILAETSPSDADRIPTPLSPTTNPAAANPIPFNSPNVAVPGNPRSALVVNRASQVYSPEVGRRAPNHGYSSVANPPYSPQVLLPAAPRHEHGGGNAPYGARPLLPAAPRHGYGQGNAPYGARPLVQAIPHHVHPVANPAVPHHHHPQSPPTIIRVPTIVPANPPPPIVVNPTPVIIRDPVTPSDNQLTLNNLLILLRNMIQTQPAAPPAPAVAPAPTAAGTGGGDSSDED